MIGSGFTGAIDEVRLSKADRSEEFLTTDTTFVYNNANQVIKSDVAELIALEFETELIVEHKITVEEQIRNEFDNFTNTGQTKNP